MNLEELRKIINIFESSSLSELEIEEKGVKFRLVKKGPSSKIFTNELALSRGTTQIPPEPEREKVEQASDREVSIKSPLVGTFYRSHSPGEEPFTEVGERVHPGQTLCIVEAMKVMNEITSEVSGKIKKILVENGQPVEYDQELFIVEKEE